MTYNGIRGMMGAIHDRYTRFMDPKAYKELEDDNQGEFVGIGALLGTNKAQQVYVVKPLPGGPAIKAKVLAGDIILKVDDKSTLKLKDTDVVKLIRGEPNTRVTLTLLRKGVHHPVVISMIRAHVHQEVVQHAMIDPARKIGYISLSVFNEESDVQVGKALADLEAQGMRGLVFDLRENPGGLLDIAREIASRFVPNGPIVWIKDKSETQETMEHLDVDPSQHANHLRYPLVVLVNGDSASAAEIVSGAIKDTGTGILVGEKTFGKGLVQTIMGLPDGSAVAITTQHYYTAHKNDINHKGIVPNVPVTIPDDNLRKDAAFRRDHPEALYDLQVRHAAPDGADPGETADAGRQRPPLVDARRGGVVPRAPAIRTHVHPNHRAPIAQLRMPLPGSCASSSGWPRLLAAALVLGAGAFLYIRHLGQPVTILVGGKPVGTVANAPPPMR